MPQDADAPSYHNPLEAVALVELLASLLDAQPRWVAPLPCN